MQAGVQYMPVIVPMDQAMKMSQSGGAIPMGQVGPQQMQGMMAQQHQQGKGGGFGYGMNQAQNHGGKGFGGNYGGGPPTQSDDEKLGDWLSKRFNKSDSAGSGAGRGGGKEGKSDQQARKGQQQMGQA